MKRCLECEFFKERGHWTKGNLHHCRSCHRSWTGVVQAHCTIDHHHFSSPSAFDMHIVNGVHTPPEHVRIKGRPALFLRDDKWGRTWSLGDGDNAWWLRRESNEAQAEGQVAEPQGPG